MRIERSPAHGPRLLRRRRAGDRPRCRPGHTLRASLPRHSGGTSQLRANAVTSAKVKDHSLKAVDFASGQLPAGAQGAPVDFYIGDTGPGADQALCDAGDVAVGGGGIVMGDGLLTESQPLPFSVGAASDGWVAHAKKADGGDAAVTAWSCAPTDRGARR